MRLGFLFLSDDEPKDECEGVGSAFSRVGVLGTKWDWDAGAVKGDAAGEGSGVGRADLYEVRIGRGRGREEGACGGV